MYADLYHVISGDDEGFLTSGPDLRTLLDATIPDPKEAATKTYRLQYWVRYSNENFVAATINGARRAITTVFTHLSGGLCTVHEPNERNLLVYLEDGVKFAVIYTFERSQGIKVNEFESIN